jgi:hypothetical protein
MFIDIWGKWGGGFILYTVAIYAGMYLCSQMRADGSIKVITRANTTRMGGPCTIISHRNSKQLISHLYHNNYLIEDEKYFSIHRRHMSHYIQSIISPLIHHRLVISQDRVLIDIYLRSSQLLFTIIERVNLPFIHSSHQEFRIECPLMD